MSVLIQNDFDHSVIDQVGHRPYPVPFDDSFHMYRVNIQHRPWSLTLAEAEIEVNTMAETNDIRLPAVSPLAHEAKRQDTVVWPLERV